MVGAYQETSNGAIGWLSPRHVIGFATHLQAILSELTSSEVNIISDISIWVSGFRDPTCPN